MQLFIGLMSGTSMDGIDAALVDMDTNVVLHGITYPYSDHLKEVLQKTLLNPVNSAGFFSQLNTLIGREFAQAALELLKKTNYAHNDIVAIGSHGQTICHDANCDIPYTVQLGCGHTIAELTQIPVVADFRTRDIVTGGQGAPFAPIYHQALFNHLKHPVAIVNIGGIANITFLENANSVVGYDVGPGNCLLDAWIYQHQQKNYDQDGAWAGSGKVIPSLLDAMLADTFFKQAFPKSIGKEFFSLQWLKRFLSNDESPADVQATLLALTVESVVQAIVQLPSLPEQLLVCGGGVHNQTLMTALQTSLDKIPVNSTATQNAHPDFIEAAMFAWLAKQAIDGKALDLRAITSARYARVLGVVYGLC